jgi:hypothetical protein
MQQTVGKDKAGEHFIAITDNPGLNLLYWMRGLHQQTAPGKIPPLKLRLPT